MTRPISSRVVLWASLALLTSVLTGADQQAVGQEKAAEAKPAAAKKTRTFRGRLPNHYRSVVDKKQREAIYKIQLEYAPKIGALKAQLAAMIKQRDEEVAAVLTPEQLKRVEEAKAAAKAKRDQKRKPAGSQPAAEKPAE